MKRILAICALTAGVAAAHAIVGYDNTLTSTGGAFAPGGATSIVTGTKLLADDLLLDPSVLGGTLGRVDWSVNNANTAIVNARMRVRFYNDSAGTMGTNFLAVTFNAFAFAPGANGIFFDFTSIPTVLTQQAIWFSIVFDANFTGATATVAELNNLGMLTYDPPTVGSSADTMAVGNVAGVQGNSPAVTYSNFGAAGPKANFYLKVQATPEPGTFLAIGTGLALLAARRRRK